MPGSALRKMLLSGSLSTHERRAAEHGLLVANAVAGAQGGLLVDEDHPQHASFVCDYCMIRATPVQIKHYTHKKKNPAWEYIPTLCVVCAG
mmetsp:Transcript_38090/g.95722  ORF Transcript_38090/g.95722 Transcript_38090/m.95722 type:complete len:91 (-) Transcript_38090:20-292(-)